MNKKIAGSYPEKKEILQYLLKATNQKEELPTNADAIIDFLKLKLVCFDFNKFEDDRIKDGRAILSYNQRVIAVNSTIGEPRINFSKFHDIAHYVLPKHVEKFYFCRGQDMSPSTKLQYEMEANAFAADLIYKGDIFTIESNSMNISFETVIFLKDKYGSSIESTARHFVECNWHPCLFVVYEKEEIWKVKYCFFSRPFLEKYLQSEKGTFTDDNNEDVIKAELQQSQIISSECKLSIKNEREMTFSCQYFNNGYNIFAIIKEKE